jgi:DMSO/TMAO reductase YedYZ molybdopterin-dependent catalytic subunit
MSSDRAARGSAALAGMVAAAVALGAGELLAGVVPAVPSPVVAVGNRVVDLVPPAVKDAAIAVFGLNDKLALVVGILVVAGVAGAVLGTIAARRLSVGVAGFAAFGVLGALAAAADPQASRGVAAGVILAAATVGVAVLAGLLRLAPPAGVAVVPAVAVYGDRRPVPVDGDGRARTAGRRRFLLLVVLGGIAAVGAGALGQRLGGVRRLGAQRAAVRLPPGVAPAAGRAVSAQPAGVDVAGLSPLFTPNAEFYRIDTALTLPVVDLSTWRLRVGGLVDRPFDLGYDDLLAMELVEADVTLCCVSNEVGGQLIGNARWLGVPLADLLARAGVRVGAGQIVGRSVDGWTAGFPTPIAFDGRPALVAVGMNGEPLPLRHGFPARLVVPGLYGYVSATKWLEAIELATWDGFDGYWIPRGWAKEGPVKTQSRIDVPRRGARVAAGPQVIAGVAWAQPRRIAAVEVQVDDGPWRAANLGEELSEHTWRQWWIDWDAPAGAHTLRIRATDDQGVTQPAERRPPAPDGATGWHTVSVTVSET